MTMITASKVIFSFFLNGELKAKRTRALFIISAIPFILLLIAKIIEMSTPGTRISTARIFSNLVLYSYIQYLIPILSLLFGSRIVNEEMDRKTLVFLTTCPIPKPSVIMGKFVAYFLLSLLIVNLGLLLCFLSVNLNTLDQMVYVKEILGFAGAGFMALLTYMAFFTFLGTVMKKAIIPGLLFVFFWENIVQYFPGVTQKFTITHFVKSLLPVTPENKSFFKFLVAQLEPSSTIGALIVMMVITGLSLAAACYFFQKREYIMSDAI